MIREIAVRVLEFGYVCDHCLGRQFSRLGKENNAEKGKVIRRFLCMEDTAEKTGADPANFRDKHPKCAVCEDVFERLPEIAEKIAKKTAGMEFETFLLGIRMSDSLVMNEEALWERIDVRYSEPIKSEISRELAGMIAEKTGRRQDAKRPDIIITFDLQKNETEVFSNPIFIYGEYKKFVRGLPQTSSPHYRESVQDIIAKPFMKFSSAASNVFHALGREDKEARCLVWRPFILELKQPVRRKIDLKRMEKAINRGKRVKVRGLKFCKKKDVSELKARRPGKQLCYIL